MPDGRDASRQRLRMIAALLNISVEQLYDGEPVAGLTDTGECLRLWNQIETDAGRDAVLIYLRKILADQVV